MSSWTSPLSERKVSNIAALVYRHDNFSRNDFALKVDALWHGCPDVFLLNFCVASFWTGFTNLQRQNTNSAPAVSCNRSVVNFPGKDFFWTLFPSICVTRISCVALQITNSSYRRRKVSYKTKHWGFKSSDKMHSLRIQNLRIRDQTSQTPNPIKMFQTRYKSGKITSRA